MTRKRKLKLYILELEKERNELMMHITHLNSLPEFQDGVQCIFVKHLKNKLYGVEKHINTLMLINS